MKIYPCKCFIVLLLIVTMLVGCKNDKPSQLEVSTTTPIIQSTDESKPLTTAPHEEIVDNISLYESSDYEALKESLEVFAYFWNHYVSHEDKNKVPMYNVEKNMSWNELRIDENTILDAVNSTLELKHVGTFILYYEDENQNLEFSIYGRSHEKTFTAELENFENESIKIRLGEFVLGQTKLEQAQNIAGLEDASVKENIHVYKYTEKFDDMYGYEYKLYFNEDNILYKTKLILRNDSL